jgi:hypothetical protein
LRSARSRSIVFGGDREFGGGVDGALSFPPVEEAEPVERVHGRDDAERDEVGAHRGSLAASA